MPSSTAEVNKRNTLFSILLIIIIGLIWLSIVSIWAIYLAAQAYNLPPSVFHLAIWPLPYYVATGAATVSSFYSRDIKRGLCDGSILSAVLYFIGTIANGFFVWFANSLWARCITGVASLDSVEKIECNNDQWLLYITFVWSWVFLVLGVIAFGAFTIDAFMRFDTRGTTKSLVKGAKKAVSKAKSVSPISQDIPNVTYETGGYYGKFA